MFGAQVVSAVQDPSYPVYVDTSVMMGQTGLVNKDTSQFDNVVYLPCNPGNGFWPDFESLPRADVYYICSPNNPTGAVATKVVAVLLSGAPTDVKSEVPAVTIT